MKKLLIPAPKNAADALHQARVLDRAVNLAADSYRWEPSCGRFIYDVFKPGNDGPFESYVVNLFEQTCTCKHFEQKQYCKHYLAVEKEFCECEQAEREIEEASYSEYPR
jgi:hypothetical protein